MLSNEFEVHSGVLQGNVLSPILFVLFIDFIMNRVTQEGEEGLDWSNGRKLANLEYADDALLLCKTLEDLQCMLNRMHEISKKVRLKQQTNRSNENRICTKGRTDIGGGMI